MKFKFTHDEGEVFTLVEGTTTEFEKGLINPETMALLLQWPEDTEEVLVEQKKGFYTLVDGSIRRLYVVATKRGLLFYMEDSKGDIDRVHIEDGDVMYNDVKDIIKEMVGQGVVSSAPMVTLDAILRDLGW